MHGRVNDDMFVKLVCTFVRVLIASEAKKSSNLPFPRFRLMVFVARNFGSRLADKRVDFRSL